MKDEKKKLIDFIELCAKEIIEWKVFLSIAKDKLKEFEKNERSFTK